MVCTIAYKDKPCLRVKENFLSSASPNAALQGYGFGFIRLPVSSFITTCYVGTKLLTCRKEKPLPNHTGGKDRLMTIFHSWKIIKAGASDLPCVGYS